MSPDAQWPPGSDARDQSAGAECPSETLLAHVLSFARSCGRVNSGPGNDLYRPDRHMGAMMIEMPLLAAVRAALPGSTPVDMATGGSAAYGKGAYVLVIALREPVGFALGGIVHQLSAGHYLYAGSAYGPGGIDARLRRHFGREKTLHWHVDRLTTLAASIRAFALEGGSECEIVTRLSGLPDARHPIPGFGSSDCRTCVSHLLQAPVERMTSHIDDSTQGRHV